MQLFSKRHWLDHFKLQFHQVHASGHMSKEQLVDMVKEIRPKKIFAVHTENQNCSRNIALILIP
jgi:mRNA degradation ribonuclease J1/J2